MQPCGLHGISMTPAAFATESLDRRFFRHKGQHTQQGRQRQTILHRPITNSGSFGRAESVQFSVNRSPLSALRSPLSAFRFPLSPQPYPCCEKATSRCLCCVLASSRCRNASKHWVFRQHSCCRTANTCALRCSKRPSVQQIGALATFCHRFLPHRTLVWARLPVVPSFR